MIKDDMTPYTYRIRFFDDDVERIKYSDDRRYYERLVGLHGHLSDLRVEAVTLTTEQKQRLGAIKDEGLSGHDASVYVRFGTTESEDTGYFDADKLLTYRKNQVEPKIKAQRKAAEALGVVSSGIRYAGDPSNRQALSEALMAAEDGGMPTFDTWKDSDGEYRADVPVSDVRAALRQIGQRRGALMELEGQYVMQSAAGEADAEDLDWSTPFDDGGVTMKYSKVVKPTKSKES